MTPSLGFEPEPQWWVVSALTTAPALLQEEKLELLSDLSLLTFT